MVKNKSSPKYSLQGTTRKNNNIALFVGALFHNWNAESSKLESCGKYIYKPKKFRIDASTIIYYAMRRLTNNIIYDYGYADIQDSPPHGHFTPQASSPHVVTPEYRNILINIIHSCFP